ncbi:hypothetical protein GCM10010124_31120 [Pilimelia terevasa]|uniref:Nudix hydrolase domain-containing protein n=1 Tax=Pilimelia terevasa TaxID=53372 RepID=A0A8J3BUE7_9ACTN|nr:NUDIX domain-containing protein [Pilimelia terevasa]GGK36286.1 hypothetical protein GCM10010124_31120 [Pilimelia terevasa]
MPTAAAARQRIADLATRVTPIDHREDADRADILAWVASGQPLFRTAKPDVPAKHLAVYFVLLDEPSGSVLLVDHIKAGCWLPPGGHVDPDEDPAVTAVREAAEELGIDARFYPKLGDGQPLFLSVTRTRGPGSHTDVTMWFVMTGDRDTPMTGDPAEFARTDWFSLDQITAWAPDASDPHIQRFVAKLQEALALAVERTRLTQDS